MSFKVRAKTLVHLLLYWVSFAFLQASFDTYPCAFLSLATIHIHQYTRMHAY